MKPLTLKGILKKHKQNPKDEKLHKDIETKEVKKETFNKQACLCFANVN